MPCDHAGMTDDEPHRKSFEEAARELADEIRQSIERYSQADPEEIARAAGVDPEQLRAWVDNAGEWLRSQFEGAEARRRPAAQSGEEVLRDAEPHPLDVPTREQGVALAALDSGRWTLEPGTATLSVSGGGPGPRNALGLVRELRERDWIDADGAVTLVGRHALGRWLATAEQR
jgi:transposase-like protein